MPVVMGLSWVHCRYRSSTFSIQIHPLPSHKPSPNRKHFVGYSYLRYIKILVYELLYSERLDFRYCKSKGFLSLSVNSCFHDSANLGVAGNSAILHSDSNYNDIRFLYDLWCYSTCKKLIFLLLKILNDQLLIVHYEYYFNITQFSSSSTYKSNKNTGGSILLHPHNGL